MTLSRRDVVKSILALGAAAGAGVVRGSAEAKSAEPVRVDDPRASYPETRTTEDLYRREFVDTYGDSATARGYAYHCVNCQGNCAWEVWTKDGKVTRENQSAHYPQISNDIPDANPRGCNKGAQHSQGMYEQDRLLYPMRRVGERGAGKWKRIGWDEAVTEVASRLYETMLSKGPAGNYVHIGAGVLTEARAAAVKRLGTLIGAVRPYIASYVGDMFPGVTTVYGEGNVGCTYDFIYTANTAVFWGCNPNTSRIPDAHYIWEAKYNGAKIIVITPELNSTAIHADLWVPVKAGYDGHLALSIMQRIVAKKLYKEALLAELTDLPLLVRRDTKKLLRLSDLDASAPNLDAKLAELFVKDEHAAHEVLLAYNRKTKKLTPMPGCEGSAVDTLRLEDLDWHIDPALEGSFTARLADGKSVQVTTVFTLLREELEAFTAEKTQALTGVHPSVVDTLARDLALPRVAVLTMGFSVGKHFNGLLSQRAIAALAALTCRMGPTGGMNTENEWNITGLQGLTSFDGRYQHRFASGFVSEFVLGDGFAGFDQHYEDEDVRRATGEGKADYRKKVEAMLAKSAGDANYRNGKSYWNECETFLLFADARFRRNKAQYREAFLRKAKFIAYGDVRMSDFATFADVLLPCKSHYEVWDLRTNPGYHRFANLAQPPAGLKNVGEAKSEWEIATLIVEKLQAIAVERAKKTGDRRYVRIPDETHTQSGFRAMDELVKEYTLGGKLRSDRDAVEYALEHTDQFKPHTTKSMYDQGGFLVLNQKAGKSSPLYADKPYNTFESNLFLHQRFETLSGRLSFYIDDDLWIGAGAAVPTAREPLRPKRFPFLLVTPHARWSVHSMYKTSPTLLRLQRGKPYAMINPEVAAQKGIRDGDDVRMFNDLGSTIVMAKLVPGVPKDAVVMEHGWEPFMYKGKAGHNRLGSDTLNVLELSDGWGHLEFGTHWDGNQHAYEATLDLEKA